MLQNINQLVFENNLSKVRLQHGKTASEIATWLNISRMQYYRYEQEISTVPAKIISGLAYYYSCTEDCLFKTTEIKNFSDRDPRTPKGQRLTAEVSAEATTSAGGGG